MRKQTLFLILFAFFTAQLFSSCEVINPSEEIPCYLRIDSFLFVDTVNGSPIIFKRNTQKITDAWVFVDGKLVGIYDYPTVFPLLISEGTHRVRVYAGVLKNGDTNDREIYPFFTAYNQDINFKKGKTDTILPRYSYNKTVLKYPIEWGDDKAEGFEGAGTIFKIAAGSAADTIFKTSVDSLVLDGNYSAEIILNKTDSTLIMETAKSYTLPTNRRPVYIEISYRTQTTLRVGLYGINIVTGLVTVVPFINLNPTNGEWRKVYLNIASEVSLTTNNKFKVYIKADHLNTQTQSQILLDNFQLIYQ